MICPICGRFSPDGSSRCTACGADVRDPDVQALMRAPATPLRLHETHAGALGNDRFLGLSGSGVLTGSSLRRVGVAAAAALLLGALLPLVTGHSPLTPGVSRVATAVPMVLAAALFAVVVPPRGILPPLGVGALLAAGGLVELALGLTPFGREAGTAIALPLLPWLAVALAGIGVAIRVVRPSDPFAAPLVAIGAVVFVVGGLLPHRDVLDLLPAEFRFLHGSTGRSLFATCWDALEVGQLVPDACAQLAPLVLLPLAAVLAFRRPAGLWDAPGNALRFLGIAIVLWLPAVFALAAVDHAFWPRARVSLLATGAMLSLTAGATAVYAIARARRDPDQKG